jgi:hypothetical protein
MPVGELVERASMRVVGQFGVGDTSSIHARAADADLAAMLADVSQHDLCVVVALRHVLGLLRAAGRVADEEHLPWPRHAGDRRPVR